MKSGMGSACGRYRGDISVYRVLVEKEANWEIQA
jgi:hypothetical protein